MCDKCNIELNKNTLIEGAIKMYALGSINGEVTILQIKKIVEDTRFEWKK